MAFRPAAELERKVQGWTRPPVHAAEQSVCRRLSSKCPEESWLGDLGSPMTGWGTLNVSVLSPVWGGAVQSAQRPQEGGMLAGTVAPTEWTLG